MAPSEETSSEDLMERFRRCSDPEAIERLIQRFLRPALAVAGRMLNDASLAEDAVQEAFMRVVRNRASYQPGKAFSSWFYAIVRNVCRDVLRRRSRRKAAMAELSGRARSRSQQAPDAIDDGPSVLDRLPEDARAVLELRIVHELPFRDVAAALGISEEPAKKRAQRALGRLREISGLIPGRIPTEKSQKHVPDPPS